MRFEGQGVFAMNRVLSSIAIAVACACVLPARAFADLRVVATTPDLAAVAKAVAGGHADISSLALATQDPHFVDARPHLALDLSRADLLLVVGLNLEVGWLPTLQVGSRNGKIQNGGNGYLDCSQFVSVLEAPKTKIDRAMGDIHPGGNPHYMYDPRQVAKVAAGIAQRMAELDPKHAADFQNALHQFRGQLDAARARWEKDLAGLRGAKVIDYHKSMPYLASWLGFEVIADIEPKPGIPPNPKHVTDVLTLARSAGVKWILQENYYPQNIAQTIAERCGAKLAVLPSMPAFDTGQSYVDFLDKKMALLKR
jgi:zinc/manganese transport system substrate-binding protein